jgi:anaerobic magnesium-protoporphyrin IX monomethyl ester cyclase
MRSLLIYVPSRNQSVDIPYGLLYVSSAILEEGHEVKILDLCLEQPSHEDLISQIETYGPDIIGFGAITSGYRQLKEITSRIRPSFPNIPLIVGGSIASISRLLITRANIDAVVMGEGEVVIKNVLREIGRNGSFSRIAGLAYRCKNGGYNENPPEKQIVNMDSIPIPPYHLIDVRRYCISVDDYMSYYNFEGILSPSDIEKIKSRGNCLIPIISSRGCTNRCSFCYTS